MPSELTKEDIQATRDALGITDHLRLFYNQETVREAVRAYAMNLLDEGALKAVYKGEDVSGYKEARATIDRLFGRLEELYGQKDKPLSGNKAR